MRTYLIFPFLIILTNLQAQIMGNFERQPEDTICFVNFWLYHPGSAAPYANSKVTLRSKKGRKVHFTTDTQGKGRVRVPIDDVYFVHCGEQTCHKMLKVRDVPYVTYNYQAYTRRFIYLNFDYKNYEKKGVAGEEVLVEDVITKKIYRDTTDAKGKCQIILPFSSSFNLSVKYRKNFTTLSPKDVGKEYKIMRTGITWYGAKEKERMARIADSLARVRTEQDLKRLDSLAKIKDPEVFSKLNFRIPIGYGNNQLVLELLKEKAAIYKQLLRENPTFFVDNNFAVLSPLHRLRNQYKRQIIVTDITGSMGGYMEEVMLWHAMNFTGDLNRKYLFFNDGDGRPTEEKTIGSTGGFYFCQGRLKDFAQIIETMAKGMSNGGGGEYPENDVEALLAASRKMSKYDELILVADNFSPVRDLELMYDLKVPVRIILCGVEKGGSSFWGSKERIVNEEYLDLARATGGSIHTVEQDIRELTEIKDGESIEIMGRRYELQNGKFILLKDM